MDGRQLVVDALVEQFGATPGMLLVSLSDDPVQQATETIGAKIAAAMAQQSPAKVLECHVQTSLRTVGTFVRMLT
jgi:hypothetical protein